MGKGSSKQYVIPGCMFDYEVGQGSGKKVYSNNLISQ